MLNISLHLLLNIFSYLGGNAITVVEGLEQAKELRELHIENQRLIEGEKLLFDPRSLQAIKVRQLHYIHRDKIMVNISTMQASLTVINVSGNRLDSIEDLQCLTELVTFIASDNEITNMKVSLVHMHNQ